MPATTTSNYLCGYIFSPFVHLSAHLQLSDTGHITQRCIQNSMEKHYWCVWYKKHTLCILLLHKSENGLLLQTMHFAQIELCNYVEVNTIAIFLVNNIKLFCQVNLFLHVKIRWAAFSSDWYDEFEWLFMFKPYKPTTLLSQKSVVETTVDSKQFLDKVLCSMFCVIQTLKTMTRKYLIH